MRTTHKHGRERRAFVHMRALVAGHRNQWRAVEEDAYETPDPQLLVLVACIGCMFDVLDDRLDELLEGTA